MTWLAVLAVGAGSFLFRVGPLLVLQRVKLPAGADAAIRHAASAAIAALITLSVRNASAGDGHLLPTLLAVAAGAVLAARKASMLRVLAVGVAIYAAAIIALP